MENWQFLIQKQGDHTWRNLESPNLKIWAGNYRILARSDLKNTDIDVRVSHISVDEVPKRRLLKRSRRTNSEGLMAVIPFTNFKPGIWELRCSGDIMSEMLGQSWQHTLCIQVSSQETTPTATNQLTEISDLASEGDTEVSIVMNHGNFLWFKGETTEQILQNLLDLALPEDEPLLDEEIIDNAPTLPPPLPLNLTLDQDTYVAPWGNNFIIHGDVEANEIEDLENERFSIDSLCQLRLEVTLRSPLESRILKSIQRPLTNQFLPFSFSTLIDIPPKCESKLLLADINLYGALAEVGEVVLLANHTFIITADATELLAQQASQLDSRRSLLENNPVVKPKPSINIRLELFNLAKTPKLAQFHVLKPSPNQPLPPQIKPLVSGKVLSPQLPNLPYDPTSDPDSEKDSLGKPRTIEPIDLKKLVIKPVKTIFPYLKRLKVKPAKGETVHNRLDVEELITGKKSPELPMIVTLSAKIPELSTDDLPQTDESMVDDTFSGELIAEIVTEVITSEVLDVVDTQEKPSLPQQWIESQVSLLTEAVSEESSENYPGEEIQVVDVELLLNGEIVTEENTLAENIPLELNEREIVTLIGSIAPQSQEIVIDDWVIELDADNLSNETREDNHDSPLGEDETGTNFSPMILESLATPQLYLPEGELIAGKSVMVRVKLPEVLSWVAVKLWVEDYQTRSLVDGPHILTDLHCNAEGGRETAIYLKIPFGCLEIRLAAIAVNQSTQQESDKFTVIKTVVPPDLPTRELDEILGM